MFKSLVVLFSVLGAAPAAFAQSGPPPLPPEARGFEQRGDFRGGPREEGADHLRGEDRRDFRGNYEEFPGDDFRRGGLRGEDRRDFRGNYEEFPGDDFRRGELRGEDRRDFRGPGPEGFRDGAEGPRERFQRGDGPERGCAYGGGRYGRFGRRRWFEHGRYDWRRDGGGHLLRRPEPGHGFRYD